MVGIIYYNQNETAPQKENLGISVSDFQVIGIRSVNSSGSLLALQFTINDNTPVGGTIENASFVLYADGSLVGRGILSAPVKVPVQSSILATSYFLLPPAGALIGSRAYFLDLGTVSWRAVGNALVVESLVGTFKMHFNCTSVSQSGSISCNYLLN